MMKQLKKPMTFEEQINHLKNKHGLIIEDRDKALKILSEVNYYRLSAYGIRFRQVGSEKYKNGTTLYDLFNLYQFDSELRTLLFPMIVEIEIRFRTKLSYYLTHKYGSEGYRNGRNFKAIVDKKTGKTYHKKTIDDFDSAVERNAYLPCVMHHKNIYGGHFPIWAAIEMFTFGMATTLYGQMETEDRNAVAKQFGIKEWYLFGWVLSLLEVRNICAHANRLYNLPLKQTPKVLPEYKQYKENYGVFMVMLVLKRLYKNHSNWTPFVDKLVNLSASYPDVDWSLMGFPENWEQVLR